MARCCHNFPAQQKLLNTFSYKDGELFWKHSHGKIRAGDKISSVSKNGYKRVWLDGKHHYAHHLIWIMHNGDGSIPEGYQIDHIDHNRLNNNIWNLRLVTPIENNRNRGVSEYNTSGRVGVCWDKRRQKWYARISVHDKNLFLGYYNSFEDACAAREEAEKEFGFHENHIKWVSS